VIYTVLQVPNDAIFLDAQDSPRVGADYKLSDRSALVGIMPPLCTRQFTLDARHSWHCSRKTAFSHSRSTSCFAAVVGHVGLFSRCESNFGAGPL